MSDATPRDLQLHEPGRRITDPEQPGKNNTGKPVRGRGLDTSERLTSAGGANQPIIVPPDPTERTRLCATTNTSSASMHAIGNTMLDERENWGERVNVVGKRTTRLADAITSEGVRRSK